MRGVILALAIAGAASTADAGGYWPSQGPEEELTHPAPPAPDAGARQLAENTIRAGLAANDDVAFRALNSSWATSIRRGAFGDRIPGPISVVCGQYTARKGTGGESDYSWFFVAIKHGQVLWADVDKPAGGPGNGYYGCKNAGLTG